MKKKYYFTFRVLKVVIIVFITGYAILTLMQSRIKGAIERNRDKKSKALGLEYFSKKFKYYDNTGNTYSLTDFPDTAVIVNYIDNNEESSKLILNQKNIFQKLEDKKIVFFYIANELPDIKSFNLDNLLNKKVFFLIDKNLTRELLSIEKYPYSLMFDNNHRLVGKVDKFQDWNSENKITYLRSLAY